MVETFREQVQKRLFGLSRKDVCFFAWLCAVRALPFLGVRKNFKHWKSEAIDKRQIHLLAIFNAIDTVTFGNNVNTVRVACVADAVYATYAAADTVADDVAYAAVRAVNAVEAATAADDVGAIYTNDVDVVDVVAADADVAAAVVVVAAAAAADAATADADVAAADADAVLGKKTIDLKPILFDDLENILTKEYKFQNDVSVYGDVWGNFQRALRDVGCEYWGEWYKRVFAKGFMLDEGDREEIKLRLNVPGEIMDQGAAVVARYVMELKEKGAERFNETRVIILGNKGSGKTSLAKRLKNPTAQMPNDDESTEGVDVIDWHVFDDSGQHRGVNVYVWDFAGHVITHAAHRCFMSERCLYILVVDGRTEGDGRTEYWLEQIRNYGGDSPVLVLVNVRDEHFVDLPENTLKTEFPSIIGFYQVDIGVGGVSLWAFRQKVMGILRDSPLWKNQQISAPTYKVKEALRQKFNRGNNFISLDDFDQIAKNNGIKSEGREQLLKDLHDLGICLWYENLASYNMLMLNPVWISRGIYRLINWGSNAKKCTLSILDFREVFKGEDACIYTVEKAGFLFDLMEVYQLAFFKNPLEIFVPLLLPANRPESGVPEFVFGERLRMEYYASQALPPYTVARLAVRHSKELNEAGSWKFGAVLNWEGTDALVEESERTRSVTVTVKGQKRREYIAILRDTLNDIFGDYRSSFPELKYEVLVHDPATHKVQPIVLPEETIKRHVMLDRKYFEPKIGVEIPLDNTVEAYKIDNNILTKYNVTNIINLHYDNRVMISTGNNLSELEPELLCEARLICIGDADAGKTTLIEWLVTKKWKQTTGPTRGIAIRSTIIDDPEPLDPKRKLGLNYWDFGGQDIMHSMHQYFMAERCLYIIVLDGRRDEKPEYWLDLVSMYGGRSPVMIVMNKIDHNNNARINEEKIREIYGRKLMHISFHYLSCKKEIGLVDFQIEVLRTIKLMECYQTVFSKNWNQVRQHVRHMRDANGIPKNYLSIEEYGCICKKYSIDEKDVHILLGWLHDMGICLSYQHIHASGVVEKIKVLQPEWITTGIYKIINDERATIRNGFVTHQMLRTILEENDGENVQFRNIECDFILEMMRIFQYSYSVGNDEFFPMLTSIEKSPLTPKLAIAETITYRIRFASLLPVSVLHNVIVRLREDVQPNFTWREGTFLSNNKVYAQLAFGEDRKVLDIKVAGAREDAARYLLRLLDEIHRVLLYIDVEWTEFVVVTHENVSAELDVERLQKMYTQGLREEYVTEFDAVMPILPILRNIIPQLVIDKLQNAANDVNMVREILKASFATQKDVKMMRQQMAQIYVSIREISNKVSNNEKYALETYARLNTNIDKILQCVEDIKKNAANNDSKLCNAIKEVYDVVKSKNQQNLLTKLLTLVQHTANLYSVCGLGQHLLSLIQW
ncbi:MAG: ADP-ribosylation factor-like protein [Candidatus Bathyarchaeota archaeon]|nr:ADP-ribosylation factor-like protein [Candidatus Termiticorpusculum sp.]